MNGSCAQMGMERQVLQQLIDQRAAIAEAERLGLW